MSNELPLQIVTAALTPGNKTPQEMIEEAFENASIVTQQSFALFSAGTTEPSSDTGPWAQNGNRWKYYDYTTGAYVDFIVPQAALKYIFQTDSGDNEDDPDPDDYLVWYVVASGVVTSIRTHNGTDWVDVNSGTPNALVAFGPSGTGLVAVTSPQYSGWKIGQIIEMASNTPDPGWALFGATLSRTTHVLLYNFLIASGAITAASGDGTSTFIVPDGRGRVTVAAGTGSGLTARTIGQTGGEETHALTSGENGPHTHTVAVAVNSDNQDGGTDTDFVTGGGSTATSSSGSGTPHENMPPFIVFSKWMYHSVTS